MFRLEDDSAVAFCDGLRRRDFLHAGSIGLLGLGLPEFLRLKARGAAADSDISVILLLLVGGPSQLDTWDMKPEAPAEFRGPYRPINTNVPGIRISEIFPRMAGHADKYAIVRTLHHDGGAVHDIGHQLIQTGRLFRRGPREPHMGCVVGKLRGSKDGLPPHVLLPGPIGPTGGDLPHGQDAGYLGGEFDPFVVDAGAPADGLGAATAGRGRNWRDLIENCVRRLEAARDPRLDDPAFHDAFRLMSSARARAAFDLSEEYEETHARYGRNRFGQSCLLARRLVAAGVRFVTVNMFETVFDQITWDAHGWSPFSPLERYADQVGPMFDNAFTSLIEDLARTGELERTLILATGEFGRTPRINPAGGRDHWPRCWSMIMAGGGVQGGRILGESDRTGAEPKIRPVTPAEVAATVYDRLGIPLDTELLGPDDRWVRIVDEGVEPLWELFT